MAKRILINGIHSEEVRVAITEDSNLIELEVERTDQIQMKGNIYKAKITRIEPSLQAAFLDIGSNRNGFLQTNDINQSYFSFRNEVENSSESEEQSPENKPRRRHKPSIEEILKAGQNLVVQVAKDERDAKGATLTTNLSIPGRYLVLMIGSQRGGVSRKINDEAQRRQLKDALSLLRIPGGMGVIVRTAGINRTAEELQADLDNLVETWFDILQKSLDPAGPNVLYKEGDLAVRTIRDYFTNEVDEIVIDDKPTFDRAVEFATQLVPNLVERIKFHDSINPLFSAYDIEQHVAATNHSEVILPSGGSIVINQTEAIVAIDVNSGRATSQHGVEETAVKTNLEAAEAIARQLRLRDLGGLVVIDFIDMVDRRHKSEVEKALKNAVRSDRAKVELGRISKFGLLELSRQRLKTSIVNYSHAMCPTCLGRGKIRTPESSALEILRKIQSAVLAGGVEKVALKINPSVALWLLNNKRREISQLEIEHKTEIVVYADGRLRTDEVELDIETGQSRIQKEAAHSNQQSQQNYNRGNGRGYQKNNRRHNNRNARRN